MPRTKPKPPRSEHAETKLLVEAAFNIADSLGIDAIILQADELSDVRLIEKLQPQLQLIWVTRAEGFVLPELKHGRQMTLSIPETGLGRMSQIKMGLFLAIFHGYIEIEQSVICVCGVAGSEKLDTVVIANPRRDFPWLKRLDLDGQEPLLAGRAFARLLDIALRIAAEGKEGHPVGTAFVLGNQNELRPHLKQLVMNPFAGHDAKNRNIHRSDLLDTLREFSALDGAIIINNSGNVVSAGTYLEASAKKVKLRSGLGARHRAAASITAVTNAVSVVVSESSRNVSVFFRGQMVLEVKDSGLYVGSSMT